MSSSSPRITRRRWLESASLWGLAAAVSAKGFSSLSNHERQQFQSRLAETGRTLDNIKDDLAADLNEALASRPSTPAPPQPSFQELHPELYQGDYAQFLDKHAFRYIRTHEIITPHTRTRKGVANGLPRKSLWHNIPETLRVADEVRHRLGTPLSYITSAYRTPAYNRECGGATRSYHTRNNALDLVYEAGSEAAYEVAFQLREEGFFQGGLGFYSGFIHIDTRGSNATW
ncbi:MAG: D-Ala-D-Ala carboxypeptidase family metallohydrolase [Roseibacillus sp.]